MLLRRKKRKPMGLREETRVRCPGHLAWLRGLQCTVNGAVLGSGSTHWHHICEGRIEAAHVRTSTDGAMGIKPGDNWAIPLCSEAHRYQHEWGEHLFELDYRVDMKKVAAELWAKSPHRLKWEQKRKG